MCAQGSALRAPQTLNPKSAPASECPPTEKIPEGNSWLMSWLPGTTRAMLLDIPKAPCLPSLLGRQKQQRTTTAAMMNAMMTATMMPMKTPVGMPDELAGGTAGRDETDWKGVLYRRCIELPERWCSVVMS